MVPAIHIFWTRVQALAWVPALAWCALAGDSASTRGYVVAGIAATLVSLAGVLGAPRSLADVVTLLRAALAVAVVGAPWWLGEHAWWAWSLLALALLGDLLDGAIARRLGGSSQGALLDMECDQLTVLAMSDASNGNAPENGTQGGYLVSFAHKSVMHGGLSPWTPVNWKSYRLRRATGSTMSGETQACRDAASHAVWLLNLICEATDVSYTLLRRNDSVKSREGGVLVDAKSLYDHVTSLSSAAARNSLVPTAPPSPRPKLTCA